mgnify:CR=1 FL=1
MGIALIALPTAATRVNDRTRSLCTFGNTNARHPALTRLFGWFGANHIVKEAPFSGRAVSGMGVGKHAGFCELWWRFSPKAPGPERLPLEKPT